ncbi:hypothetical protein B0H63DRAFT_447753 [Podospora didyma]|uniref:Fungal N-terminal domain-containing protein n=1 Tax=Podospora didyma TaxID=330526 RepID=A0AAE0NSG6_9PEZI|nr:hypothetical protein B0H63DRAFT_447753 [Podospora didyma]
MTSPVSISEAFLLCKLAFKLGRTFTSGRRSAPAELREVENQLYSLSAALLSLDSTRIAASSQLGNAALASELEGGEQGSTILAKMLENCGETLAHLGKILEQYAAMKKPTEADETSFPKRWSRRLVRDFKNINVVLGVVNNEHIGRVEDTLATVIPLLKEIQEYVAHNQHVTTAAIAAQSQAVAALQSKEAPFELRMMLNGSTTKIICPRAMLDPNWSKSSRQSQPRNPELTGRLFTCGCPRSQESPLPPHATRLSSLAYLIDFEELFIQHLATNRARSWLRQATGTTLAFVTTNHDGRQEALVLRTFLSRHQPLKSFLSQTDEKPALVPKDFAHIVIHYRGEMGHDEDIVKTTVRSAETFKTKTTQMCIDLSLIAMRLPRENKVIVLKLQAGGIHTEEIAMAEADITDYHQSRWSYHYEPEAYENQMSSLESLTCYRQTDTSEKVSSDIANDGSSQATFRSRTWVAQMLESGRTQIKEYPNGFNHLILSDVRTNKLFEGWVRSRPLAALPLIEDNKHRVCRHKL